MWVYYRTVESGPQVWKAAPAEQERALRADGAYHIGIYALDKLADVAERNEIKYKGDLWLDLDHEDLEEAIHDARTVQAFLEGVGVPPEFCDTYASGGKGFHFRIPASLFGGGGTHVGLPLIHKAMVAEIEAEAEVTCLDMQLYCMGHGKTLRVENKQRANGQYKVPITKQELQVMTPESYRALTSEPRPVKYADPPKTVVSNALAVLFAEAKEQVKNWLKAPEQAVTSEQLALFENGEHPLCIQWLVAHTNIAGSKGEFNLAKMSLARYLMSKEMELSSREELMWQFSSNWETTARHPTPQSRYSALKGALSFGQEHGFSCGLICRSFTEKPCAGCPVQEKREQEVSERCGVVPSKFGYQRVVSKGVGAMVTNFTLTPLKIFLDGEDQSKFLAFEYQVHEAGNPTMKLHLDANAWTSATAFKAQLKNKLRLSYVGTDADLQHLKQYLTSFELMERTEMVCAVTSLGIHRHQNKEKGIDEMVWVQDDWSYTPHVCDTMKYGGIRAEVQGQTANIALDLRSVPMFDLKDSNGVNTLIKLLKSNSASIMGPIFGWTCATWLKEHLRTKGTDRHFPLLHLWGPAGIGKTDMSKLMMILGGADYYHSHSPIAAPSTTPFVLKEETCLSTTIPRIIDEVNEMKMGKLKYDVIRDCMKSSATGLAMAQGRIGRANNGVVYEQRLSTAPLVVLATQPILEKEIVDRAITVQLTSKDKNFGDHIANFEQARDNGEHLFPIARMLMEEAVTTSPEWVHTTLREAKALLPEGLQNRPAKNWQVVLLGFSFFERALQRRGQDIPMELALICQLLKDVTVRGLNEQRDKILLRLEQQEVDVIVERFSEMAMQIDSNNQPKLVPGIHYIKEKGDLHIFAQAVFPMYLVYMRSQGKNPELADYRQFKDLIGVRPYYLGEEMVENVPAPKSWLSLDIKGLNRLGISVDGFRNL